MATKIIAVQTTGAFTIPSDFPAGGTLQVECFGSAGYSASGGTQAGGGAYSKTNSITGITAGQTVYIKSGTQVFGGSGSWFNKTSNTQPTTTTDGCYAEGGVDFAYNVSNPLGGRSANGVGDLKYSGGTGGAFLSGGCCGSDSVGGKGGAAGPNGNGANAFSTFGGGGGANGGSAGNIVIGGNGRGGSGGGLAGSNGTNGGGGGYNNGATTGSGGVDAVYTDYLGVQWGPFGGGGGNSNGATQGYGGGASKATDVGTINSNKGVVILTYNTTSAATSSGAFLQFF
jgi:hypothetical protein